MKQSKMDQKGVNVKQIFQQNSEFQINNFRKIKFRISILWVLSNEVSTRHDMNYGQVRYPTLVDKMINLTKAEPLFGT